MKITSVEIFDCAVCKIDPALRYFNPVLVRINTDQGVSGIGEAGISYATGSSGAIGVLKDLAPLLLGRDPMQVEAIWEFMFRGTFWAMGGGPIFYSAMSAVDIALWDIRGKTLNAPVYQLLGGKTNTLLRAYAGQLQFGWGPVQTALLEPEEYKEAARAAIDEGYDCVKVDPVQFYGATSQENSMINPKQSYYGLLTGREIQRMYDRLKAVRDTVGPDVDIILETHSLLGVNSAIQLGRMVEDLNILYFEEPVHPMNHENMQLIAKKLHIPLASGERIYTRWGYRPFFEKQALAVIQPDICTCGGITEAKKICDMAKAYDTAVQIHVCGTPVTTAASLQVEAVITNFLIHEHNTVAGKKAMTDMCIYDYQPVRGSFSIPDIPGLGQSFRDDVMAGYLACTIC
jgi:L-alanine-DL-glutamate epimerase-like enolase superfamily enzyme